MTKTDSEGRRTQEREEYWVTITDFEYKLDLTEFIFPYGFIQSVDDREQDVAALINAYIADDNMLKTLEMTVRQIIVIAYDSAFVSCRSVIFSALRRFYLSNMDDGAERSLLRLQILGRYDSWMYASCRCCIPSL